MDDASQSGVVPEPKRPWFDAVCAILMAASSLSTAWCSYQNSRWSAKTSDLETREDACERQVMEMTLESRQFQVAHFEAATKAIDAHLAGNEKVARFYTDRFTNELKSAWEKWMALKPFENPEAPPHPFMPGLYTPRFEREIREARAGAAQSSAQAKITGNHAAGYLSNTVLLATVLFFAGTAGKFDERRVRQPSLAFALALFLYASIRMIMLPVA